MLKLSSRLQAFYDLLIPEQPVWDFCCDHGYLGLKALESERFSEVHFVDPVQALIQKIEQICRDREAQGAVFHPCAGEDLEIPVKGTMVVAGVGAETIIKIISGLKSQGLLEAERLVLSPHRHEDRLWSFMESLKSDYTQDLLRSHEVQEGSRTRPVWAFQRIKLSAS